MGEIADMMLDGTLCQCCGEFLGDAGGNGFPQYCASCAKDARREQRKAKPTPHNTHMAAKAQICPYCKGTGYVGPDGDMVVEQKCAGCSGTGKLRHA